MQKAPGTEDSSESTNSSKCHQQVNVNTKPFQIVDTDDDGEESEPWFEGENDSDSKAYGKGGYLRVRLGDKFNGRYTVEKKLGWGHFSTVWLATDSITGKQVALKIQKSAEHYMEAALDEIELLTAAKQKDGETNFILQLLDHFNVYNMNGRHISGRHYVFVFELLGPDLLTLIKRYKYLGLPSAIVKQIAKQVLVGLDNLHTKYKIIHTDLKPENILLSQPAKFDIESVRRERDILIKRQKIRQYNKFQVMLKERRGEFTKNQRKKIKNKITRLYEQVKKYKKLTKDYELPNRSSEEKPQPPKVEQFIKDSVLNEMPRQHPNEESSLDHHHFPVVKIADLGNACWVHRHFTEDITTCQYRAPEAILGQKYGPKVDVWSHAAMIFELVTGDYLFNPKENREYRYTKDEDHLALIAELCGKFKKSMTQKGHLAHEFFTREGDFRNIKKLEFWPLVDVLRQKYKKSDKEAELLASFLSPMLEPDAADRASARDMIKHPWLRITQADWDELIASEKGLLHWESQSDLSTSSSSDDEKDVDKEDAECSAKNDEQPVLVTKENVVKSMKVQREMIASE